MTCQRLCYTLNTALQTRGFAQAAALTPADLPSGLAEEPSHVEFALATLHEAMLESVLEFESKGLPEVDRGFQPITQDSEPIGVCC